MSFPRYPKYKASGVEWLGEVPAHWEVKRAKIGVDSHKNGVWGDEPNSGPDDLVCLRVADFDREHLRVSLDSLTARSVSAADRNGRLLQQGDLLLEKSGGGDNQPVGFVVLFNHNFVAVCSNFVARVTMKTNQLPAYWCYQHAAAYHVRLNTRSIKQTSGIQNLDAQAYFDERFVYPPLAEQRAIALFLDRETKKIDELVAAQERLIELLKEKRQAVISHAVTKGLDPAAPMKPSGVEWLGEVPEHWEVKPIRKAARLESGHTPSRNHPEYWVDCTVPWFTLADVWQIREEGRDVIVETKEKVSELGLANSAARRLPPGTVMLSRTASVGFSAIMGVEMATTQDFANWVCGEHLESKFLLHVFRAMRGEFTRLMMGSTHNTIYMPDIQAFRFAQPPRTEQRAIAAFLDRETKKIDELVAQAESAIALLTERRSALISAAVTGQIDVRNAVPEVSA
jgi:type I restriction enzyme S subunit